MKNKALIQGSKKLVKIAKLSKNNLFLNKAQITLRQVQKVSSKKYKTKGYQEKRLKVLEQKLIAQYENTLKTLGQNNKSISVRNKDNTFKAPKLGELDKKEIRRETNFISGNYLKKNLKNLGLEGSINNYNNLQNLLKDFDAATLQLIWKYKETVERYLDKFLSNSKNRIINETLRSLIGKEEISEFMFGLQKLATTKPTVLKKEIGVNSAITEGIQLLKILL